MGNSFRNVIWFVNIWHELILNANSIYKRTVHICKGAFFLMLINSPSYVISIAQKPIVRRNFIRGRHQRKTVIQIDLWDENEDLIPLRVEMKPRKNLKSTWTTIILSNRRKVEEMKTSNRDRKIRKKKQIKIKNSFHNTLGTIL